MGSKLRWRKDISFGQKLIKIEPEFYSGQETDTHRDTDYWESYVCQEPGLVDNNEWFCINSIISRHFWGGTSEEYAGDDVLPFDGQQPLKAGMYTLGRPPTSGGIQN